MPIRRVIIKKIIKTSFVGLMTLLGLSKRTQVHKAG